MANEFPTDDMIYNIMNRIDRRNKYGRLTGEWVEQYQLDRDLLRSYKNKLSAINRAYKKQRDTLMREIGSNPYQMMLLASELGMPYQLQDLSGRVRTNEELNIVYHALSQHTVRAQNERMRDNYIAALTKMKAPKALITQIQRLSGSAFYRMYMQASNVNFKFVYSLIEGGATDDQIYQLASNWQRAGLKIAIGQRGQWIQDRTKRS